MQQETTRAVFLFTMHSTKQLSEGLMRPGGCKQLMMAKADAIQNLRSTPAATEVSGIARCCPQQKHCVLCIQRQEIQTINLKYFE